MIYNEITRELITEEEDEYIHDMNDEEYVNLFKRLTLGKNDNKDHYESLIIDDIASYMMEMEEGE